MSYVPTITDYEHLLTCFNSGVELWQVSTGAGKTSLKAWLTSHNGAQVDTLQVKFSDANTPVNAWHAGVRTVKAGATYARFCSADNPTGSRRDYAGVRVLLASHDRIVCCDTDMGALLIYCAR